MKKLFLFKSLKKLSLIIELSMVAVLLCTNAYAVTIVDTGTPGGNEYYPAWVLGNSNFTGVSNLAAQFTLDQDYCLTGLSGFIEGDGGNVNLIIYGDLNDSVDNSSSLYSKIFSIPYTSGDWYGVSSVNWFLAQGTYWIAFEPEYSLIGAMPDGVPCPLDYYASGNGLTYYNLNGSPFGIKISGDIASTVPLPSTVLLLGTGLIGFVGAARRRLRK